MNDVACPHGYTHCEKCAEALKPYPVPATCDAWSRALIGLPLRPPEDYQMKIYARFAPVSSGHWFPYLNYEDA